MSTNGRANGHADGEHGRPDPARLAADLRACLKHSEVIDERAELQTYGYDASFLTQLNPIPPDVAVIARSAEDVSPSWATPTSTRSPSPREGQPAARPPPRWPSKVGSCWR